MTQHWFFTSHYLKVAALFQLTFSKDWINDFSKISKRKRTLCCVDLVAYTFILTYILLAVTLPKDIRVVVAQTAWLIFGWAVILTNFIAMRYIHRKISKVDGILADHRFMALYFSLFFIAILFDTLGFTLEGIAKA